MSVACRGPLEPALKALVRELGIADSVHFLGHVSPIQRAIERLEAEDLVDDEQFASYWVGQRQAFRPRGPRALRFELRARGVSNEAITPAIEAVADEQSDAACRAGIREARRRCATGEVEFSRAVTNYLVRRGFDFAATRIAVRQLWSMVEEEVVAHA